MNSPSLPINLTKLEIPRLPDDINLTDGHNFRSWTDAEKSIVARATDLMYASDRRRQFDLEKEYREAFYLLTGQSGNHASVKHMLCSSASMSLELVANVLRLRKRDKIRLVEPTFDNLAEIFRRHKLSVEPITEQQLSSEELSRCLPSGTGACCIVTPNNPTGWLIPEIAFRTLCDYCEKHGIILVVDACFRVYASASANYDQYRILAESGVEFIVIEDTGKTWPTLELKLSILACSEDLYQELYDVYTDFILHVSPFSLVLLTEFVKLAVKDRGETIRALVQSNRAILVEAFPKDILVPDESGYGSVLWAKSLACTSDKLVQKLGERGVHILPGMFFFWKNMRRGSHHVRIALTRDVDVIQQAARVFASLK